MDISQITNYSELQSTIAELRLKKKSQEGNLKVDLKDFAKEFDPISLIKSLVGKVAKDDEVKSELLSVGMRMGTNLVVNLAINKFLRAKSFISRVFGQGLSTVFSVVNLSSIASGLLGKVSDVFRSKDNEEEDELEHTIDIKPNGIYTQDILQQGRSIDRE